MKRKRVMALRDASAATCFAGPPPGVGAPHPQAADCAAEHQGLVASSSSSSVAAALVAYAHLCEMAILRRPNRGSLSSTSRLVHAWIDLQRRTNARSACWRTAAAASGSCSAVSWREAGAPWRSCAPELGCRIREHRVDVVGGRLHLGDELQVEPLALHDADGLFAVQLLERVALLPRLRAPHGGC